MEKCCKSNCRDAIRINKFLEVRNKILENDIPYTSDSQNIMICTPLGNQAKFNNGKKADIVLSGFCTAPDAAISYLKDPENDEFKECRHSFNTGPMKNGIEKIFKSIGVRESGKILDIALSCSEQDNEMSFLFTQLLCMISSDGRAAANGVENVLKKSESIRNQANYSITAWYDRINSILDEDGIILLMGKHAKELIKKTYLIEKDIFKIDYYKELSDITLFDIINKRYKLFCIFHAAGLRYPKNKSLWFESECRRNVNKLLNERFPDKINKII